MDVFNEKKKYISKVKVQNVTHDLTILVNTGYKYHHFLKYKNKWHDFYHQVYCRSKYVFILFYGLSISI